eukprot:4907565-Pyramimonas_sp.AAC.1
MFEANRLDFSYWDCLPGGQRADVGNFVQRPTGLVQTRHCAPLVKQKGAADRRRLRRITAAPCLLESPMRPKVWPTSGQAIGLTACSPQPLWNP